MMPELLSKHTRMRIFTVENEMPIRPNCIYLGPPAHNVSILDGSLYLQGYKKESTLHLPIDSFFESLAKEYKNNAAAIILSGTGSDGKEGIKQVREVGGLVMAQDDTAKYEGMPHSA